jgi:hypothetical protein
MPRKCRTPVKYENPLVVLDRVEGFARRELEAGETNSSYAMPLHWILQIADIVRDLQEAKNAVDIEGRLEENTSRQITETQAPMVKGRKFHP